MSLDKPNTEYDQHQADETYLGMQDSLSNFRHKVIVAATIVTIIGLIVLLFVTTFSVIPLIFISILIAVLLRSLADPLARRLSIEGRWAVILVALTLIVSLVTFFTLTGPSITAQFDQLGNRIPEALDRVESGLREYGWGVTLLNSLEDVSVNPRSSSIFSRLTGFFSSAFGAFTNAVLVIVAGIYMAFEPSLYIKNFVRLFPAKHRERTCEVLDEGYDIVRRWLIARLISMVVVGILTFIGLTIINMPLALTLAVIAALLSFIPNIGPILSSVPAILVGFTNSLLLGVLAAVVYVLVQQIENYLITPNIQRRTVSLPPALVMLSQVFLTLLFGWLGLFIAAPLVAFSIVLVKSVYLEDFLGDEVGRVVGD